MKIIFLILAMVALIVVTGCVSTADHNGISNGASNIKEAQ
jgi:outer membrane murein-binding lipoprotein Lpp